MALSLPLLLGGRTASATSFCNANAITINDRQFSQDPAAATPSPSTIAVSGLSGTTADVDVTLNGVTHGSAADLDIMLVSPTGQAVVVVSDAGGNTSDLSNVTITFDDEASGTLTTTGGWTLSSSKTFDNDPSAAVDIFPGAPTPPATTVPMSTFDGFSPNGTWSLYVVDDAVGDAGTVANGWCLDVTPDANAAPTSTTLSASPSPSVTGNPVSFLATVTSGGSPVTAGSVTFSEGATVLAPDVPVDGSGHAFFETDALTEGSHQITATFNGTPEFATSSGSKTQVVDNETVVTDNKYCNPGSITVGVAAGSPGTPYPSRIVVAGAVGTTSEVSVTLKDVTHTNPDDLDVLLVGPGGQQLVLVSDAGGTADMASTTLTLDDDAAATLADSTSWGASPVTAKPTNYGSGDTFPAPAPALDASPATALSVFDGTSPNGTWSLYVVDDSLGETGAIGGWCLTIDSSTKAATSTVVGSDDNPSTFGDSVTYTAAVSSGGQPVPTGTVTFSVDGSPVASDVPVTSGGLATYNTDSLSAGSHVVQAAYNGDDDFLGSDDSITQQVDQIGTTTLLDSSSNPSTVGDPVTFTATVSSGGAPVTTGTVTFTLDGTTTLTSDVPLDASGQATVTTSSITSGSHTIDASYSGDADHIASDATQLDQVVNEPGPEATVTNVTASINPAVFGDEVTFSATVTSGGVPVPAGSVTFSVDGVEYLANVTLINGQMGTSFIPNGGSHIVTVHYNGAPGLAESEGSVTEVVNQRATSTAIESNLNPSLVGDSVTFLAKVTVDAGPAPTGTVTFSVDGVEASVASMDPSGAAAYVTSSLTAGSHVVTARYDETANHSTSDDVLTQVVNNIIDADAGGPYSASEGGTLTLDGSASTAPPGATFSWDVNGDGTFGDATGVNPSLSSADLQTLGIDDGPATYAVQVQVTDGVATDTSAAATFTLNNAAPSIAVGDGSGTAGSATSVHLDANDPSAADQASSFSYHIDWGDGSAPQTASGPAATSFAHTYAAPGVYTVAATATDKDGATSTADSGQVLVSGAGIINDPCSGGTALIVRGTSGADTIGLTRLGSGATRVTMNGANLGSFTPSARIVVLAGAGNDSVTIDKSLTIPRIVDGEAGNDTIVGGNGAGTLIGGDGNDTLSGGNGRDILIGGVGADTLRGDNGDDILIAGPTTYDDDDNADRQALCSISAEWNSSFDYKVRVSHLRGTTPGGANGSNVLTPGGTVSNDTSVDRLTGGNGPDWFLLNTAGGGTLDSSDAAGNEIRTDL